MDYAPYDSSGTDDDLPPSHQNRPLRGGRVAGSERSAAINSMPYSNIYAETDMEAQIHQLEQEAYSSVLRAFKAQADAITWEKESLITELRKELRLSNEEHRELSTRVNSDDLIRRIREWRQSGGFQAIHDPVPSPTVSASRKNKKINKAMPSPPFPPQPVAALSQPSSLVAKRGPITGAKGKKQKPGQTLPPGPLMRTQQPADGASLNNLVGRRVRTRWPDDNSFYEAVITDYDPTERRHALVYDIGTANETWEWVDLAEISPDDIQWVGEDPGIYRQGGSGHVMGRGRDTTKGQFKKDFPASKNGNGMKGSDEIQILNTDTLIKEVERVFSGSDPDPLDVERAKKLLNDQEQALADAISLLAALSDNESDEVAIS